MRWVVGNKKGEGVWMTLDADDEDAARAEWKRVLEWPEDDAIELTVMPYWAWARWQATDGQAGVRPMHEDKWTYKGDPVTLIALAGNPIKRVLFGAEVKDADGDILKLPANKETGIIDGLLDSNGKPVNVRCVEWLETGFGTA